MIYFSRRRVLPALLLSTALQSVAFAAPETVVVYGERGYAPLWQSTSLNGFVTEETLQNGLNEHPNQVLKAVPGVWVSRGNGQEHLTAIRSPVFTGAGACGAFWMAEDGIALRARGFCNTNQLFDAHFDAAEHVEVYKGPHTSLFGSNAQFGGINLQLPQANEVTPWLSVQGSSLGYKKLHLRERVAGESHSAAVLATAADDSGWRDDSGFSQQKVSFKHHWAGSQWQVDNGFTIMHLEQETAGYIEGQDAYKDPDIARSNANPEAYRDADAWRLYSRWRTEQGDHHWQITPYARKNHMAFLMHFVPWQPTERNAHESLGVLGQWQYQPAGPVTAFVLSEVEYTSGELSEVQSSPAPFGADRFPQGTHYDYDVAAANMGLAAGISWQARDALRIKFSARYDSDHYDYQTNVEPGWACAPGVSGCRFYRPADRRDHFDNTSAELGATYQVSNAMMLFARASQGFRIPQATELYRAQAPVGDALESEEILAVEAGVRLSWETVRVQSAFYQMRNRNGIFQNPERLYVNGAQTDHKGLEYELDWQISEDWRLSTSGEWARHTYSNNPQVLGLSDTLNLDGNRVDTAPDRVHNLALEWQLLPELSVTTRWQHMSRYYTDPENNWQYPGHDILDFTAKWQWQQLEWFAVLANGLDTAYAERADVSFGEPRYFPGAPRALTVGLRVDL